MDPPPRLGPSRAATESRNDVGALQDEAQAVSIPDELTLWLEQEDIEKLFGNDPETVFSKALSAAAKAADAARAVYTLHPSGSDNEEFISELASTYEDVRKLVSNVRDARNELKSVIPENMEVKLEDESVLTQIHFVTALLENAPGLLAKLKPGLLRLKPVKKVLKAISRKTESVMFEREEYKRLERNASLAFDAAWSATTALGTSAGVAYRSLQEIGDNAPQIPFMVFLSHAGEDKDTIAIPIWRKLKELGVSAFLDKEELRLGENANDAMELAMNAAPIGVFILSVEFAAKKWTMKELFAFLEREAYAIANGLIPPLLIPIFYRLGVNEWEDQDLFRRNAFAKWGFVERLEAGETSVKKVRESLRLLSRHTGIENAENATNERSDEMRDRRERLVDSSVERIAGVVRQFLPDMFQQGTAVDLDEAARQEFDVMMELERVQDLTVPVYIDKGAGAGSSDHGPFAGPLNELAKALAPEQKSTTETEQLAQTSNGSQTVQLTEDELYTRFQRLMRKDSKSSGSSSDGFPPQAVRAT